MAEFDSYVLRIYRRTLSSKSHKGIAGTIASVESGTTQRFRNARELLAVLENAGPGPPNPHSQSTRQRRQAPGED